MRLIFLAAKFFVAALSVFKLTPHLGVVKVVSLPVRLRLGALGHDHTGARGGVDNLAVAVVDQILPRSLVKARTRRESATESKGGDGRGDRGVRDERESERDQTPLKPVSDVTTAGSIWNFCVVQLHS